MDKERLEFKYALDVAKRETAIVNSLSKQDTVMLPIDIVVSLIKQAEQVQELEKKNKTLADNHFQQKELTQSRVDKLYKLNIQLHRENKRYREAFKQIKLQILFDGAIEDHRKYTIEIIDEALEGESDE